MVQDSNSLLHTLTDNTGSTLVKNCRNLTLTEYEHQVRLANGLSCHSHTSQLQHGTSQIEGQANVSKDSELAEFSVPNLGDNSDDRQAAI